MRIGLKKIIWIMIGCAVLATLLLVALLHRWRPKLATIQGAVIRRDQDTRKQLPIGNVLVTATRGKTEVSAHTDSSGYFKITFPDPIWPGQTVYMHFAGDGYSPLDLSLRMVFRSTVRRLVVAAMSPLPVKVAVNSNTPAVTVANVRIRYTVNTEQDENIGSMVKTFQIVNQGNIPCRRRGPCSPDGNWKATAGSITMDAGQGNEYRDVRASCIAGPCPFTQIDPSGFMHGGRIITVSALNWSSTATFLVEAEVFHTSIGSNVRESYPVIYGRLFNFILPATQEGASIEAEINGQPMIFPLSPDLYLSWATCAEKQGPEANKSMLYRCDLKPGFQF